MTARIIDGKAAAAEVRARLADIATEFARQTGRQPGLATILVGEDPASAVYVRSKGKATSEAGMASFSHKLPDTTSEAELCLSSPAGSLSRPTCRRSEGESATISITSDPVSGRISGSKKCISHVSRRKN